MFSVHIHIWVLVLCCVIRVWVCALSVCGVLCVLSVCLRFMCDHLCVGGECTLCSGVSVSGRRVVCACMYVRCECSCEGVLMLY